MKNFYETKALFRNYTQYTKPLSYAQWVAIPDDYKAAVLFVQFFNQILLAWEKAKSYDGDPEEAVETVIQYLIKNVDVIKNDEKRFTPAYIYRVAYNCLYCICHDRKRDKDRREYEVSAIQQDSDGEEFNLFDTVVRHSDTVEYAVNQKTFWAILEAVEDVDTRDLIDELMTSGKLPSRMSNKNKKIVAELRIRFADVADAIL